MNKEGAKLDMNEIIKKSKIGLIGICGGFGSATAEFLTFGFDNIKTKMQMNGKEGLPVFKNLRHCMSWTWQSYGFSKGFYKGFSAAFLRQLTYSTTRISVYEWLKRYVIPADRINNFFYKFIAGGIGGAIGCIVGNPFDVLKIRLINDYKGSQYKGFTDCCNQIFK